MQRSAGIGIYRCFLFSCCCSWIDYYQVPGESHRARGKEEISHSPNTSLADGKQLSAAGRGSRLGDRSGSINYQFGSLLVSK